MTKMNLLGKLIGAVAIAVAMPLAHADYTFANGGFQGASDGAPWVFSDPNVNANNPVSTALKVVSPGRTSSKALQFKSVIETNLFSGTAKQDFTIDINGNDDSGYYLFEFWTKADPFSIFSVSLTAAGLNGRDEYLPSISAFSKGEADGWTSYSAVIGSLDNDFTLEFTFGAAQTRTPVTFLLDDVSFTACPSLASPDNCLVMAPPGTVPEPGTLFLVGAALAAGAAVRRKVKA